jgi:carbon monoxide dehydrogenase subunit G
LELIHQFTVPASIDVAWAAFNDLERVAPCFPGASLTSYDGEAFEGVCKVKLGPISLQYSGTGRFVSRDEATHTALIEAKGKDKRGNGTAAANVTATLTAAGDDATDVTVKSDLNITGKPAQFGRGVMQDVSDKLLGQFATCLESKLGEDSGASDTAPVTEAEEAPVVAEETPVAAEETPIAAEAAAAAASGTTVSAPPRRTVAEAPAAELDLGATVLPVLLKRYAPQIVAAIIALWILRKILSRG